MRVLVLGGTAFMGPVVVRLLREGGHEVAVFHRGRTTGTLPPGVTTIRGDRHDPGRHTGELRDYGADVVIDMICFNRNDARDLVEVFGGHAKRAVVASSCDVYANFGGLIGTESAAPEAGPLTEGSALRRKRYPFRAQAKGTKDVMYEYDKLDVEDEVMAGAEIGGARSAGTAVGALPACVLRLPMVYGEGDRQRRLAPLVKRLEEGAKEILLGRSHAGWATNRGYVENMARAIVLATLNPVSAGRIYNVADERGLTEAEFTEVVIRAGGYNAKVRVVDDGELPTDQRYPGDPAYPLTIDSTRIRAELGYRDEVELEEGVKRSVEWERRSGS